MANTIGTRVIANGSPGTVIDTQRALEIFFRAEANKARRDEGN